MSETVTVDGREIEISHPDKLLYPDAGIPKRGVVEYYHKVAGHMLPHVGGRPVSMQRFPDGLNGEGFYQKEVPEYFPEWIERVEVEKKGGGSNVQLIIDGAATLVYLAVQACLTPHVWLSRRDRLDHPDRMIFDLDPPDEDFSEVRWAARKLTALMHDLGLRAFPMTTGSRGIHVVVPLDRSEPFDEVRAFARRAAELVAGRYPDRLTTASRKEARQGRLFLDYLRNAYAQTGVAPYALRARPGAPVATPLDPGELERGDLSPRSYRLSNLFRRLAQKDDPWAGIDQAAGSLKAGRERLGEMEAAEA